MKQPLIQHLEQLSTERWARRGVRALVRAAWLSVCVWCVGIGGSMLWGWPLRRDLLGVAALVIIGAGVLSLLFPKLSPHAAAQRLDQRFYLDEQLATAVEVAAKNPPAGSVGAYLLAEAGKTTVLLRRRIGRQVVLPWQDLLTLLALALVAFGLWIMSGIGVPNFAANPLPLPGLASPQNPLEQFPQEQQGPGDTGLPVPVPGAGDQPGQDGQTPGQGSGQTAGSQPNTDPQVLQALADALRDQGATRPAADALDRGDTAGAARELRELADQAGQLSDQTRDALASQLRDAADQLSDRSPELSDQLQQSARGLEQGGQDAAQALDDLARAVEDVANGQPPAGQQPGESGQQPNAGQSQDGQQGQGQGQNQGQDGQGQGDGQSSGAGNGPGGEQRQADPTDRLGVEGQAVPLEATGEGDIPVPQNGQQPGAGNSRSGFTQGGSNSNDTVNVGADPLRVPMDERDVVQEYFQPK